LRTIDVGELLFPAAFAYLPVPQSNLYRCLAASRRVGIVPGKSKSEDPNGYDLSGLNYTAFALAVYASQLSFPAGLYGHAKLASGWWPTFTGRDWLPAELLCKVSARVST
jgi:hypothetical protein